ncbi:hypothetical protein GS440_19535 [Rhodococcus hoagii]|nr:hypothetical protein [Prescottella equi]
MAATAARFEDASTFGQAGAFDGSPHRGRDRRIGVVRVDGAQAGGVVFAWGEQLLQFGPLGVELGLGGVEDLRHATPPGPLGEHALLLRGCGSVLGGEVGDERERVQVRPGPLLRRGRCQNVCTQGEVSAGLGQGRWCGLGLAWRGLSRWLGRRCGDGLGQGRWCGIGLAWRGYLLGIVAAVAGGGGGGDVDGRPVRPLRRYQCARPPVRAGERFAVLVLRDLQNAFGLGLRFCSRLRVAVADGVSDSGFDGRGVGTDVADHDVRATRLSVVGPNACQVAALRVRGREPPVEGLAGAFGSVVDLLGDGRQGRVVEDVAVLGADLVEGGVEGGQTLDGLGQGVGQVVTGGCAGELPVEAGRCGRKGRVEGVAGVRGQIVEIVAPGVEALAGCGVEVAAVVVDGARLGERGDFFRLGDCFGRHGGCRLGGAPGQSGLERVRVAELAAGDGHGFAEGQGRLIVVPDDDPAPVRAACFT